MIAQGIVLSCLIGWTSVDAGEPPKASPQATEAQPAPSAPVAIAASEIIPRAEQTIRSLQEIRFQVAADSTLNSTETAFASFAERSDRRWQSPAAIIGKSISVQQLNDVLREWSLEQSQLDGWDRALSRRSQILVAQENDVDQIIETWRATRDAAKKQALPKVALQKVAEVLREADAVRVIIRGEMAKLLNLQNQLANRREILSKVRKDIDKAREESSQKLFVLDSPPLWEALVGAEATEGISVQAKSSVFDFFEKAEEFLKNYRGRLLWHLALFLAMVAIFYLLRQGLTPAVLERLGASSAIYVLDRPFASCLLLALLLVPFFYPQAATDILRAAVLPTVIPVIRLLPRLLPRTFRRWIYLLVVLSVADYLTSLLQPASLLVRLFFLIIAAAGFLGLSLFLRFQKNALLGWGLRGRAVTVAARFGLILFGVSLGANLLGNMSLTEILVEVPIRSIYAGILLFMAAHLLMTITLLGVHSSPARWLRSVQLHGDLLVSRMRAIFWFAAIVVWAVISLRILGVLSDIWAGVAAFFKLRWQVGATEISLESVAIFLSVLLSAILIGRLLRFVLTEEIFPRIQLPRGVPGAVELLSRYGVLLVGFLIALAAAGVDFSKVTLLISALGVGIGFGLQNVVNNFVSGLILVFEHPIQVGDYIEVGSLFGEVRKIGFRASVVRTSDGADVIIPNGELTAARFINWTLTDMLRRFSVSVRVAYGTDPGRVNDILLEVARKHPGVFREPAPETQFELLGESAMNVTLFCWARIDKCSRVRSELTIAINNAFQEAGIQIPFPQQDVHVYLAREPEEIRVPSPRPSSGAAPSAKERASEFPSSKK